MYLHCLYLFNKLWKKVWKIPSECASEYLSGHSQYTPLNVSRSCDLSEQSITLSQKSQPGRR